jgi:beta-galactosidase
MPARTLPLAVAALLAALASPAIAQTFSPPETPRTRYNFNLDWKFLREDAPDAQSPAFDDSRWQPISTPHSFNDVDSYRTLISHPKGDVGAYKGIAWYRKHFQVPAAAANGKVFLEFEGMRQAGDIFLNGKEIGLSENGISAYGIDITAALNTSGDNLLAVKIDNTLAYQERATQTPFEWNINSNNSNPSFGGINRHVWLHITGPIYQTLPLADGLNTTGTYIYPTNFNIPARTCDVAVESQVHNASAAPAAITLTCAIVDKSGQLRATFTSEPTTIPAGEKITLTASGPLANARFWTIDDPALYDVHTTLTLNGKPIDTQKITTGFRKVEFKSGAGTGGVYLNDRFVFLTGFSNRATNEWAGLGQAYPDWMHDFSAQLLRGCNANYQRWMHVSPQRVDVESYDRNGIIQVCPAGDGEHETQGRQWDQRVEAMRNSMIYFRNSPSILFWEAGNAAINATHMQQMVDLRKQLDPHGGRVVGCRSLRDPGAIGAAEYFGVMLGGPYGPQYRDRAPIIETEDFREEAARRFWDDYSPPYFGFKKGPMDTYNLNSETFALAQANRYWNFWSNRISNTDADHAKWSGYASIYFSDSNADGRQQSSEVCRVSGKVDAVRLPKQIYFAERVMQNAQPDLHILGHWTYPANTTKTMYVIANYVDTVELFLNNASHGKVTSPQNGFVYPFPDVKFEPGAIKAVGYKDGKPVAAHELTTAGDPAAIKLTLHTSPTGLHADGADAAFLDVEVVDAKGQRCPTDDARIDFTCSGPAIWRGGLNSGKINSTNNLFLNTECGINRVAVRSTLAPGDITITASRNGLTPATLKFPAAPVPLTNGLSPYTEPTLPSLAKP